MAGFVTEETRGQRALGRDISRGAQATEQQLTVPWPALGSWTLLFSGGRGKLAGAPVSDRTHRLRVPTPSQREGRNVLPPLPPLPPFISISSSSAVLFLLYFASDIPSWTVSSPPYPEALILLLVPHLSKAPTYIPHQEQKPGRSKS